ncbi:MAG TPA: 50S ribosomal protein L10 [Luteibaculaceae bacterium]|nr:50S ribosomal protein L10 [Luteibaculaceae bacterium]
MNKEEKNLLITELVDKLASTNVVYVADTAGLNAEETHRLRKECFRLNISLEVVKNTLLKKAMERVDGKDFSELYSTLEGPTAILIAEAGNAPAKLIKAFRAKNPKPMLKGAFVDQAVFIGDSQLDALATLKSREELIGDIIGLLQSPAKNVVSALKSGGSTIAGLVKTLEERAN